MCINYTHRIFQITEIKIQQLVTTLSIKLKFIHAADYMCDVTLCHAT